MSSNDERFRNRASNVRTAAVIKYAGGSSTPKATFNRPAGALTYDVGDIVAPAVVPAQVAMVFTAAREYATSFLIVKARLRKSSPTLAGASFVLHLFTERPTPANADGGAFLCDKSAAYVGSFDIFSMRAFSDGAFGVGAPSTEGPICVELAQDKRELYGLLEARGAYVAAADETFEVTLELQQD
jgi:hypothetical protein